MTPRLRRALARLMLVALCLFGAGTAVRAAAEPVEIVRVEARQSPARSDRAQTRCDERRVAQAAPRPATSSRAGLRASSRLEPPGRNAPSPAGVALFLRNRSLLN